jgi:cysteine synthase B
MGIGMGLRHHNPDVKIIEAYPELGHYIQGLKNMEEAIVPALYQPEFIDEHIMIESEVAFEYARQIVKQEGIFVGMSSGAAMFAAAEVAKKIDSGLIVVIFPDRGEKYLSTDLFKL